MPSDPHQTARWRHPVNGISALVRRYNPLCQRVDPSTGQCQRPATVVHHLKDWKDFPELFFAWSNLVALCENCHPGGQRGDSARHTGLQSIYVHTIGVMGAVYKHDGGYPCWHSEFRPPTPREKQMRLATGGHVVPTGETGRQFLSSAVGESALDDALKEPI